MPLELVFFGCPGILVEPFQLAQHRSLKGFKLFFCAPCLEPWAVKVFLESVQSGLEVISEFGLFFEIVLVLFVLVSDGFELFDGFLSEAWVFRKGVLVFEKNFLIFYFVMLNSLLDRLASLPRLLLFRLLFRFFFFRTILILFYCCFFRLFFLFIRSCLILFR